MEMDYILSTDPKKNKGTTVRVRMGTIGSQCGHYKIPAIGLELESLN